MAPIKSSRLRRAPPARPGPKQRSQWWESVAQLGRRELLLRGSVVRFGALLERRGWGQGGAQREGRPLAGRGLRADAVVRVPEGMWALLSSTWSDSFSAPESSGLSDSSPMTTDLGVASLRGKKEQIYPGGRELDGVGAAGRVRGSPGGSELSPDPVPPARAAASASPFSVEEEAPQGHRHGHGDGE